MIGEREAKGARSGEIRPGARRLLCGCDVYTSYSILKSVGLDLRPPHRFPSTTRGAY
jgi:hypothetical protein